MANLNNNSKFTEQEYNTYRPIMNVYGTLYGKALVYPKCDNVDKKFNEKVKNGAIHLSEPVKMFSTEYVVMTSFELDKDPNNKPVIIINHDPSLTFSLAGNESPKVMECSAEKINDALRKARENGSITFFTDIEAVSKMVTSLNSQAAEELEAYAEELINQASALKNVNKTETAALREYEESLKQ